MYIPPEWKKRIRIALVVLPFLPPGWAGVLVPVRHEELIREAARHDADEVFGVSLPGERPGEEWHAQFMGSGIAQFLDLLALRRAAPSLVPPRYAAHVPPGIAGLPQRADGYFRVETSLRWPWWWPGGGVRWALPE